MSIFQETISEYIWDNKYRYRLQQQVIDQTIEDTWHRVAKAAAVIENKNQQLYWEKQFFDILQGFKFLPGGRILAGAGTRHTVTLFNCFVMPILEDSIQGIFDALKEGALTLQQGGGVGYDFSLLRPRGFIVHHAGSTASGPVSFMHIWDAMCATMLSTGARRGAMMAVLRCDHPDIEEFIMAKSTANTLRHFNISVLITDAFMEAVENNSEWELVFPIANPSVNNPIPPENNNKADRVSHTEYNKTDHISQTENNKTNDVSGNGFISSFHLHSTSMKNTSSEDIIYRHWSPSPKPVACQVIRRISARELWSKITRSAYNYAEPGVLFEDTINLQNNLWYREWISATNPCGEIPLPAYGACNLGALNLTQFVRNPFTKHAEIDWKKLEKVTTIATRFLDNIIDVSHYPLQMQKQEALGTRRMGLGITGLGDFFVMLNVYYGSEPSLTLARQVMQLIAETTWYTSIDLAKERGAFPFFQKEKYLEGAFVKRLSSNIQCGIEKYGIRNSHHNTIAPTGTISLLANNISNGLEPIFSAQYERIVRLPDGDEKTFHVSDYVIQEWKKINKESALPPSWIDNQCLSPQEHLNIQAAIQPYVDNAISKTIHLPESFPFENLQDVYRKAHHLGLKGCTIYRANSMRGNVLSIVSDDDVDRCCQVI